MKLIIAHKQLVLALLILSGLLLLGFFLRANILLSGDSYFLPDQARDVLLVKDMVQTMKPPLIGARAMSGGYVFHGPLWIWILGLPFVMFQGNFLAIASTYVVISLAIIASGFGVAYYLYGLRTAFFTGLFLTLSGILVSNVTGTTNAHLMPLVCIFFLLFFIRYLRGNQTSLYLAAFCAGLGVQFEGVFAVPLFLFLLLVSVFTDRYIVSVKHAAVTLVSFAIPLFTFFLFDVRHDFLMSQGIIRLLIDQKGLGVIPGYEQYQDPLYRVVDRLQGFLSLPNAIMLQPNTIVYVLLVGSLVAAFLVLRTTKDKQVRKELLALLILPLFIYTVFIYFSYPVWEHYVFALSAVAAFLFALALTRMWDFLPGKVVASVVVLLLLIPVNQKIQADYSRQHAPLQSDGSYNNQLAVVDYIYNDANGKPFGYFVYSPQVFTYGIDYLLWWRGTYQYSSHPEAKKLDTFYLIMYPPLSGDTNAHNFWVKNVLKTKAVVVDRKIFPGGIIVEKRQTDPAKEQPVDPNYYLNVR